MCNILSGDEITFSYTDHTMTRDDRQRHLFEGWGFQCSCDLCNASKETVEASDNRRRLIMRLRANIADADNGGDHFRTIDMIQELLRTLDEEGITVLKPAYYRKLAGLHLRVNDVGNAKRYSSLALEEGLKISDEDSFHIRGLKALQKELENLQGS